MNMFIKHIIHRDRGIGIYHIRKEGMSDTAAIVIGPYAEEIHIALAVGIIIFRVIHFLMRLAEKKILPYTSMSVPRDFVCMFFLFMNVEMLMIWRCRVTLLSIVRMHVGIME